MWNLALTVPFLLAATLTPPLGDSPFGFAAPFAEAIVQEAPLRGAGHITEYKLPRIVAFDCAAARLRSG